MKWSSWSSWSSCTQSCSSCDKQYCKGTQYRTRTCGNGQNWASKLCTSDPNETPNINETRTCNNIDCCKANDKFTCNSGKCIEKSLLCDGNNDCPGGEDEKDSACPGAIR